MDSTFKPKTSIPCCSICKYEYDSYYRIPRVIPKCGHTFCQKCINSSLQVKANRKMFLCTECHSETIIRKSAAEDVPKNIGVLDIVKNMKKLQVGEMSPLHRSPARDSPAKIKQYCKQHPSKELDLVCETCNFEKVCSICALIGNSHQDHKFVEFVPASKFDLNEVKQVFTIIEDTVKQTILPQAEENIIKRNEQNLIKMLTVSIRDHFRENYYKVIEKKESEIINQIKEIKFDGGISKKIEEIAKHYDFLKIKYGQLFNHRKSQKENTSLDIVEEFIQKCKDLHNEVEKFSQHAQQKSKQIFKDLSTKINQSTFFRIAQLPISLKQLFSQKEELMTSPAKSRPESISNSQQLKKKNVEFSSKYSVRGQEMRSHEELRSVENISFDGERKPFTANSINTKNKFSVMPPKHKINKTDVKVENRVESVQIPTLDLNSKVNQKKSGQLKPSSHTQRLNKSSILPPKQQKLSVQKQKVSNNLNLSRMSPGNHQEQCSNTDQPLKLKQVRPQKEIPLSLKSKFSAITKQINRQADSQSLQLISMEINDALIVYVCDYLKGRKLKYSMIKLVKNNLSDEGLSILLGYLQNDDCTQVLNLTSNQLTSKGLELLVDFAGKNRYLKTIYLSHNKISSPAVKQKAKEFQNLGMDIII